MISAACFLTIISSVAVMSEGIQFDKFNSPNVIPKNIYVKPVDSMVVGDSLGPRIIGGKEVEPNSVPYQIAVLVNGNSLCGGSLISPTHVLTAAHCTVEASFVQVRLGAHNYSQNESTQVRITSSNIKNHEDYNPYTINNDISIIFLPSEAPINANIQVVPLAPSDADSYDGSKAFLAGWGLTSDESSAASPVLLGVDLYVISNDICRGIYGSVVQDTTICTAGSGIVGSCTGDSGGPLVVDGVQVGVVSFVSIRCESGNPAGYTRISSFRSWITQNAGI